jgi:type II secretory pathway component PulM
MQNKKLYIVITDEFDEKLSSWSKRLAVSKSQLAAMAAQAGLDNIVRSVSPQETFTPQQWAQILAEMVKTGKPVQLPDGTVVGSEEL